MGPETRTAPACTQDRSPAATLDATDPHVRRVVECFAQHRQQIIRWLEVRAGSLAVAREIADEAFMTALQLQNITDVKPYIYKIAANGLKKRLKKEAFHRRLQTKLIVTSELTGDSPEPGISLDEQSRLLREAVLGLKPRAREAVRLHFWEDYTYAAIVEHFASRGIIVPMRTVQRWVAGALVQCRRALEEGKKGNS